MSVEYKYKKIEKPIESVRLKNECDENLDDAFVEIQVNDKSSENRPYVATIVVSNGLGGIGAYEVDLNTLVRLEEAIVNILGEL